MFYFFIHFIYQFLSPFLFLLSTPSNPSLIKGKASMGVKRTWYIKLSQDLVPPTCIKLNKHPTIGNAIQKASSQTRDKTWSHCQGPLKQTKLHNCQPHEEGLDQS